MGSDDFYPEEQPSRRANVSGFWMDTRPVTIAEFGRFVRETGHVTLAERPVDPSDFPDADPAMLVPGSAVFQPTSGPVDLDSHVWWRYVPGASWRRPNGSKSDVRMRLNHPVTHVAYEDAKGFAEWAGKALPTESEWERAARGGQDAAPFAWGEVEVPAGRWMANTWQGEFPWQNLGLDGFLGTSPIGSFPPNEYGLYDMIGNVWEWTCEPASVGDHAATNSPCCVTHDARATRRVTSRVIKGGSHLCAANYCLRYRPAARQPHAVDTSTTHLGFRCVLRE